MDYNINIKVTNSYFNEGFPQLNLASKDLKSSSAITKEHSYQGSSVLTEQAAALQYC